MIYASYKSSNGERVIYSLPDDTKFTGHVTDVSYSGDDPVCSVVIGGGRLVTNAWGSIEIYLSPESREEQPDSLQTAMDKRQRDDAYYSGGY